MVFLYFEVVFLPITLSANVLAGAIVGVLELQTTT